MSNRRKLRDIATGKRSNKHRGYSAYKKGLQERHDFPLHDEARPQIDQYGMMNVDIPNEGVEVIKEVPAMHTGLPGGEHPGKKVRVGTAIIHDDRSIALKYDEDAPVWALEEIQAYADKVGYSLETGEANGPA